MSDLFSKVASRSVIEFIKETGFYRNILMHVFTLISNYFHSHFYHLHIICVYIQYINIYIVELVRLKSFEHISYVLSQLFLALDSLNSADVPLKNKQTG